MSKEFGSKLRKLATLAVIPFALSSMSCTTQTETPPQQNVPHQIKVIPEWGSAKSVQTLINTLYDTAHTPCTVTDVTIKQEGTAYITTSEKHCEPMPPKDGKTRIVPQKQVGESTILQLADKLFVVKTGKSNNDPLKDQRTSLAMIEKNCGPYRDVTINYYVGYQGDVVFTKPCIL